MISGARIAALVLGAVPLCCIVAVDGTPIGKPCPCPSGSRCDDTSQTCVAAGDCEPKLTLDASGFAPQWRTPHTIRWQWEPIGEAEAFDHYRLSLGGSREEVAAGGTGVRVFDASVNPELAFLTLGGEATDGAATVTDELTPYDPLRAGVGRNFARLEIVDRDGCAFTSDIIEAATERATSCEEEIFAGSLPSGSLPASLAVVDGCGGGDGKCLACTAASGCSTPDGWVVVLPYELDLSGLSESELATGRAFLRVSIAIEASEPGDFASLGVVTANVGDPCGGEPTWLFEQISLRAGQEIEDQQLEVPLNQLRDAANAAFSLPALDTPMPQRICALYIGGNQTSAGDVFLDNIAGCWGP